MSGAVLGDVLEIPTGKGLAYAQHTHQHPQFGGLIRVFDVISQSRPTDIAELVKQPVRFSIFFPVRAAVKRGIFKVIGRAETVPSNRIFPVFRDGIANPKTGKVAEWWLWDGQREWKVGTLTRQQMQFPLRRIWNDSLLVQRIEEGWRAENET